MSEPIRKCGSFRMGYDGRNIQLPVDSPRPCQYHNTDKSRGKTVRINKTSKAMRFFFLVISAGIWAGIWLTGFATTHWLLYLPGTFLLIAAVTVFCPGLIISNKLVSDKPA